MRPPRFVPKARRLFALASLAILLAAPSQAAVTVSGSTSTNPTADGADPIIGVDNIGRLTINGGSLVTSDVAIVGDLVNGVGLVSIQDFNAVTGLTSGWVVNSLIVGDEGTGRLEIINGAVLNLHFFISPGTGDFTVGNAADSLGTVIVNGLGSMLRLGDDSFIGVNGSALLRIENEGYVIATNDAVSGSDVFTVGLRGRVELDNGRLRAESLINNGAIVGHGRVDSELAITNSTSGRFEVFGSERMVVNAVVDNDGEIALVGGEIEFLEPVTNSNAAAKVTIRDGGIVRFPETGFGLDTTSGVLASTGGVNDIYGTVRIQGAGSKIVVAGQSTAVFHDPVTNNGGVVEVFPGSTPVFLQGLTIVAPVPAPTLSVHLADPNAEPGPGIVEVVGTAQLDGDLDITLAGGFSPLPGDRFTVLSSGGLSGTFESVNTTNPASGIQFYPIHTATDVEVFATAAGETTWGVDANGQASVGSNWFGGVAPGGVGDAAAFTTIISANRTVTLDAPLTLGSVAFDDDNNYTLQGATLTLQAAPAEDAIIDVRNAHGNGAHTIAAPVALVSDLELRQHSTGAFTLAGALDNSAGRSIIKSGVGSLILAGTQTHGVGAALQVTEGTVVMNTDAGSAASRNLAVTGDSSLTFSSTQHLAALNIGAGGNVQLTAGGQKNVVTTALTIAGGAAPTGRLDLTTNAAIVDYPAAGPNPAAAIRAQILAGRGGPGFGGTWTGQGITSSTAAADVATAPESRSVGYAVNGELPLGPYASFRGDSADASAILIRYTRTGDANLDGIVNDDDVTILGAFYAPGVANPNWAAGDFDYNGFVDDDDVTLLGAFYDPSATPLAAPGPAGATTVSAMPEPSTMMFLTISGCFAMIGVIGRATCNARGRCRLALPRSRALFILLTMSLVTSAAVAQPAASYGSRSWVFIGTYTSGKSEGIYRAELDLKTGALTEPELAAKVENPSFLALHPSGKFLYAAGELSNFEGKPGGAVSAFALDTAGGKLSLLNQQSSRGAGPCHLVVDRAGKNVLVANYGGGSVAVLPLEDDGRLKPASSFVQHEGKSVNPRRQEAPHAHSINVDLNNAFALVADLGLDKLLVYRFDAQQGRLTPNDPPHTSVAPGAGPRHFAFHPSGRFAYVINEIASSVTAFDFDAQNGTLKEIHTVSSLPASQPGNSTAEVQVHPSGKFLYGSNRGHNSLAIFSIDQDTGRLTAVGHQPTGGRTPRNFGIDPSGAFVLAANQGSDNIVVFGVDQQTGRLKQTGGSIDVPSPVCVKFLAIPR